MAPLLSSGIANAVLEPFPTLPPVVRRPWEVGAACLFLGLVCLVCLVGTCFGRTWQYSGGMAQCFGPVTPLRISAPWSCSGCQATWWVEVLQRLGKEILSNMGLSENSAC